MKRDQPANLIGLLAETTAIQAAGTMGVLIIPAIAPEVAQAVGVPASAVGYQISVLYVAGMVSSMIAGSLVARFGPCRTSQVAMMLMAAGCLLSTFPHVAMLAFGSLVIGSAYGFLNPASSDLLARHVLADRRNLIFSIKQVGVPLGGMAAGLVGPPLTVRFGWSAPLWFVSAVSIMVALSSQPLRDRWDAHRNGDSRPSRFSIASLEMLARSPVFRRLALASFCFSAIQMSVIAFLAVLLVDEVGLDLVSAGALLAAVQAVGAVGRVAWGVWADFLRSGLSVLLILALLMAACATAVIFVSPSWPVPMIGAVFMLLGSAVAGWTGVYLSEIVRIAPAHAVGSITGAAMCFTFMGAVVGPMLFSAFQQSLGSYVRSYMLLVAFAAVAGILLATVRKQDLREREDTR